MNKMLPLIELQDVDTQLRDINELLGDLPKKVDKLRSQEEELLNDVEKGKGRLKEIELSLNKAEHKMADLKQKIDKLKDQQSLVTSNKQYDALTQEIEYIKEELDDSPWGKWEDEEYPNAPWDEEPPMDGASRGRYDDLFEVIDIINKSGQSSEKTLVFFHKSSQKIQHFLI